MLRRKNQQGCQSTLSRGWGTVGGRLQNKSACEFHGGVNSGRARTQSSNTLSLPFFFFLFFTCPVGFPGLMSASAFTLRPSLYSPSPVPWGSLG